MNKPQIPNARPYAAEGLLMCMAAYKEPKDMRQVSNRYIVAFILSLLITMTTTKRKQDCLSTALFIL